MDDSALNLWTAIVVAVTSLLVPLVQSASKPGY
jgi:hypothetical protein